jgi:hypothetical protein
LDSSEFGKLPASQISYAYFLVGVTTIAVVTNGVLAPGQAWQIGLDRALEILVGIGSSLLVTALVWPRYARDEFTVVDRDALGTVGRLFATRAWSSRAETPAGEQELHQAFSNQLATLRNLLQAGTRESALFHASLPCYHSFLIGLIGLYHAVLDMGRWRQGETFFVDRMRGELGALEKAISDEFAILAATRLPGEGPRPGNLDEAYAAFEHRVWELRAQGAFLAAPVDVVMEFAGHAGALRSIRDNLDTLRIAIEDRLRTERRGAVARHRGEMHSAIDWAWVKAGIKGGIAAVTAVLLIEWINPPGSAAIPFIAWLVSFQGRTSSRPAGPAINGYSRTGCLPPAVLFSASSCFCWGRRSWPATRS